MPPDAEPALAAVRPVSVQDAIRRDIIAGVLDPLVALNGQIHLRIAELSGSATLTRLLRQLSWKIEWLYAAEVQPRGKRLWPDHRVVVGAIDAGDGERAAALMAAHVRESRIGYLLRYGVTTPSSDPVVAAEVVRRRSAGTR